MSLNRYAKAVTGAVISGLAVLELALVDDFVSPVEWVRVAAATIAALGLVWGVQNEDPKDEPKTPEPTEGPVAPNVSAKHAQPMDNHGFTGDTFL